MKIEIGDYMFATDDDLEGKVVEIRNDLITLLCQDDFEHIFYNHQLFKKNEEGTADHIVKPFKVEVPPRPQIKEEYNYSTVQLSGKKPVVDLHIHEIASKSSFQNDHEALLFQLSYVRSAIEGAMRKRIRNVIFIHGVGKGKLKQELRRMLKEEYTNIEYYDASYLQFGQGATEINIHRFKQTDLA